MATTATKKMSEHAHDLKQKKLIKKLRAEENLMKWALFAALIVILLLLLFIGYATDWTNGLHKDSSTTPVSSTLDSSKTPVGSSTSTNGTSGSGGGTSSETNGTSNSKTATGTNTSSDTNHSTNSTSSTDNTSSSTNNTSTTTTTSSTPPDGLVSLYADSNVGGSLNDLLTRAGNLGVGAVCSTGLLVKDCTFTSGSYNITTKSLLGTGLITSILKNF